LAFLKAKIVYAVVLCLTIGVCILPMGVNLVWSGEGYEYREQYERLADAILEGHVDIKYSDDSIDLLHKIENPYNPIQRRLNNIGVHWDHAFYKDKYYVYFGVVPVLLTFVPYKIIVGETLSTYHATQFFGALFVVGLFLLLRTVAEKFFKKMSLSLLLLLSFSFSVLGLSYGIGRSSLYATAIISGICFAVWSIYFLMQSIWLEKDVKKSGRYLCFGALCGALVVGCRPPLLFVNLFFVLALYQYITKWRGEKSAKVYVFYSFCIYGVIGFLLGLYNYIRFDNWMEFGQRYQLTLADLSQYTLLNRLKVVPVGPMMYQIFLRFFALPVFDVNAQLRRFAGMVITFPILFNSFLIFCPNIYRNLKRCGAILPVMLLFLISVLIITLQMLMSPIYVERYYLDVYFLLSILSFLMIGFCGQILNQKWHRIYRIVIIFLCLLTVFQCIFWFLDPIDGGIAKQNEFYMETYKLFFYILSH